MKVRSPYFVFCPQALLQCVVYGLTRISSKSSWSIVVSQEGAYSSLLNSFPSRFPKHRNK